VVILLVDWYSIRFLVVIGIGLAMNKNVVLTTTF
jgi:hypothetical protein